MTGNVRLTARRICPVKTIKNMRQFAGFNANTLIFYSHQALPVFLLRRQRNNRIWTAVFDSVIQQNTDDFVYGCLVGV